MTHLDRHLGARFAPSLSLSLFLCGVGACAIAPDAVSDEGASTAATSAALSTGFVTTLAPDGMILSTGNLYFTTHDSAGATVYRTAQSASPGDERAIFHIDQEGAEFGDIVFAQVDGTYLGFFFAHETGGITLQSIPLAGGPATVLAHLTDIDIASSKHNLVTDGESLYWQDTSSIRKMPIRGGAVTVLDTVTASTPTAGISSRGNTLVYAVDREIHFVPTSGATTPVDERILVTAAARVTTLQVVDGVIYWGDSNGTIQLKLGSGAATTIQSHSGLVPASFATNGATVAGSLAWTECGSTLCDFHLRLGQSTWAAPLAGHGRGVAMNGASTTFWGDDHGIHRTTP